MLGIIFMMLHLTMAHQHIIMFITLFDAINSHILVQNRLTCLYYTLAIIKCERDVTSKQHPPTPMSRLSHFLMNPPTPLTVTSFVNGPFA